jgi:hypothetical protein
VWVDGRQLRSALASTKKWPPRRVSFPSSDNHLVTGYLEPANPWQYGEYYILQCTCTPTSILFLFRYFRIYLAMLIQLI